MGSEHMQLAYHLVRFIFMPQYPTKAYSLKHFRGRISGVTKKAVDWIPSDVCHTVPHLGLIITYPDPATNFGERVHLVLPGANHLPLDIDSAVTMTVFLGWNL